MADVLPMNDNNNAFRNTEFPGGCQIVLGIGIGIGIFA